MTKINRQELVQFSEKKNGKVNHKSKNTDFHSQIRKVLKLLLVLPFRMYFTTDRLTGRVRTNFYVFMTTEMTQRHATMKFVSQKSFLTFV